jgi:hypothetical protein
MASGKALGSDHRVDDGEAQANDLLGSGQGLAIPSRPISQRPTDHEAIAVSRGKLIRGKTVRPRLVGRPVSACRLGMRKGVQP